ncbi:tRNA:m(4)X modification enzyme TRM13 [Lamellibrachia satsuma]|nr:tRNA:m(4)X modification enzyme TRM13 [Lamellibrachia satsuma]
MAPCVLGASSEGSENEMTSYRGVYCQSSGNVKDFVGGEVERQDIVPKLVRVALDILHRVFDRDATLRKRIVCPLDSKHSCYEDHLKAHLKRCNAREGLKPVCYVQNINSGEEDDADPAEYKVTLRAAGEEEVSELLDKVRQLCEEHMVEVRSDIRFHPVLQEEADKTTNGPVAQKHIQQQASLISHMARLGLLTDHRCFIEFGAGKGGLSHWVQQAASDCSDTQYLLIDRGNNRYKKDSYHKGADQGPSFERLKMDIEHLDLGKVPSIQECTRPIVGLGKHLCGAATDLMLRCLNTLPKEDEKQSDSTKSGRSALGIVLALCCHHRCEWRSYVGKALMARWGISARQFHLMCCLSSWAVCGSRPDKGQNASNEHNTKGPDHPRYSHIPVQEREKIGYQCKRLINLGRVAWLQGHGFDAETIQYVDSGFSLENVALLATRKTGQAGDC